MKKDSKHKGWKEKIFKVDYFGYRTNFLYIEVYVPSYNSTS